MPIDAPDAVLPSLDSHAVSQHYAIAGEGPSPLAAGGCIVVEMVFPSDTIR